jgi:nucleoside-diphosphate-sugar epimerase
VILVTGATGYLGQFVLARLLALDCPVTVTSRRGGGVWLPCDLTDAAAVHHLLTCVHPEAVIHCAACVPKTSPDYDDEHQAQLSLVMTYTLATVFTGRMIFASSLTAANPATDYARGKYLAEGLIREGVVMRLPGLFGLPRRSGVIYEAARSGVIPASFGPWPAMHVQDAAEYLVRAAVMSGDRRREPVTVTYGDPRLQACYGSVGVTFEQRVQEFVTQLQSEAA